MDRPFWYVDLGGEYAVSRVRVWWGGGDHGANFSLRVGPSVPTEARKGAENAECAAGAIDAQKLLDELTCGTVG
eukprot:3600584-Pyramimonas_sp.AAC.1